MKTLITDHVEIPTVPGNKMFLVSVYNDEFKTEKIHCFLKSIL